MRRFCIRKANSRDTSMFVQDGRKWLVNGRNGFPFNMRKVADMLIYSMEIEKLLYKLRESVSFEVHDNEVEELVCEMYEKSERLMHFYIDFAKESCEVIKNTDTEPYFFEFKTYEHMLRFLNDRAEKFERDL